MSLLLSTFQHEAQEVLFKLAVPQLDEGELENVGGNFLVLDAYLHIDLLCCYFGKKHPLFSTQGLQVCKLLFVCFESLPALLDRLNGQIGHSLAV